MPVKNVKKTSGSERRIKRAPVSGQYQIPHESLKQSQRNNILALVWSKIRMRTSAELVQVIKEGLPVRSFEELLSDIDVSTEKLTDVVNITGRTLARRKKEGKLQQDESERLLRIGLLFERAKEVLGGTEHARIWFKSPKKALGGKTPLEYADTEPGAREVENLLGRIEHGVFS